MYHKTVQAIRNFIGTRRVYVAPNIDQQTKYDHDQQNPYQQTADRWEVKDVRFANVISSQLKGHDHLHMPVLDLDVESFLVPSSTPGHSHLYINYPIHWDDYVKVLVVLAEVGILEMGYVSAAIQRGATFARKPGVNKHNS